MAKIPVFSYLRKAPSISPYEAPRPAPANAVPYISPAGNTPGPVQPTEAALIAFGEKTKNPLLPGDTTALKLGHSMYDRYCAVCHGTQGRGDGPIVTKPGETGKFPPIVPNLTLPRTADRTDGFIYGIIDVGRTLMPAYGPRMTNEERWATVRYVRELQRQSGAPAAPAAGQGR